MIIYIIKAVNKETDTIEHVATSDAPFNVNPFETLEPTHRFETDVRDSPTMILAKDLLNELS